MGASTCRATSPRYPARNRPQRRNRHGRLTSARRLPHKPHVRSPLPRRHHLVSNPPSGKRHRRAGVANTSPTLCRPRSCQPAGDSSQLLRIPRRYPPSQASLSEALRSRPLHRGPIILPHSHQARRQSRLSTTRPRPPLTNKLPVALDLLIQRSRRLLDRLMTTRSRSTQVTPSLRARLRLLIAPLPQQRNPGAQYRRRIRRTSRHSSRHSIRLHPAV